MLANLYSYRFQTSVVDPISIAEGHTTTLGVTFLLKLVPEPTSKSLDVTIAVFDQLGKKHVQPPSRPVDLTAVETRDLQPFYIDAIAVTDPENKG